MYGAAQTPPEATRECGPFGIGGEGLHAALVKGKSRRGEAASALIRINTARVRGLARPILANAPELARSRETERRHRHRALRAAGSRHAARPLTRPGSRRLKSIGQGRAGTAGEDSMV